jgi:hypothetical protein
MISRSIIAQAGGNSDTLAFRRLLISFLIHMKKATAPFSVVGTGPNACRQHSTAF